MCKEVYDKIKFYIYYIEKNLVDNGEAMNAVYSKYECDKKRNLNKEADYSVYRNKYDAKRSHLRENKPRYQSPQRR